MKSIHDSKNYNKWYDVPDDIEKEIVTIEVLAGLLGYKRITYVEGVFERDKLLKIVIASSSYNYRVLTIYLNNGVFTADFSHIINIRTIKKINGLYESIAAMKEEIQ